VAVSQYTLNAEQLNRGILILHAIQRQLKKNSCNKTTFTDIPIFFLLQQQFLGKINKADLKVKVLFACMPKILFFVSF